MPTLLEALDVEMPDVVKGYTQKPIEGVSFAATFADADAPTAKETQFYSMLGTRAIWHKGWKAATAVPAAPDSWGDFHQQRWELFDTISDLSECHDLSAQQPEKLQELIALWWAEAGRYQALPLESRGAVEILTTERPQLSKPRTRYVYYPGGAEVPESVAPNIRNRSYTIAAEVDIETPEAGGVIFSQGSRFGGHALYVSGRQAQVRLQLDRRARAGRRVRRADPDRARRPLRVVRARGATMPAQGTLTLHIRDEAVGEGTIRTQPAKFGLGGGGLVVGRSGAEPVADDFAGAARGRSSAASSGAW